MTYKAVLFDLDGTLLDTLDDLADCMNRVLARQGYPVHSKDAYRYFVGDGMMTLAERVLPAEARSQEAVQNCFEAMRVEYGAHWADKSHPYEGIIEALQGLRRRGLRLAILSNKADEFTKLVVAKLLPSELFEVIAGAMPGVPLKPDPRGALIVAEQMNLRPSEFLYLGDTATDMKTALAAGMHPLGALWGFRTHNELVANGACTVLHRPTDLLGQVF